MTFMNKILCIGEALIDLNTLTFEPTCRSLWVPLVKRESGNQKGSVNVGIVFFPAEVVQRKIAPRVRIATVVFIGFPFEVG